MTAKDAEKSIKAWALMGALVAFSLSATPVTAADDSCVINVSQPLVNYGRTTRAELLEVSPLSRHPLLGKRMLTLSVICETMAERTLTFKGEAVNEANFRFGQNGTFSLKMINAQLDGRTVRMVSSPAVGDSVNGSTSLLRPGVSLVPYDGSKVALGKRLTFQVEVETHIDAEATRARSEETWEGGGRFEIDTIE